MIWSGLELIGEIPFTDVIIHSTVLAADGRRMSKSLGTGDRSDRADRRVRRRRDALRPAEDLLDAGRAASRWGAIEEGRKLANKLWNVSRLILQNAEGVEPRRRPAALEERWILARIDAARAELEEAWARIRLRAQRRTRSTTSRSTTSATGTRRRSSRGCTSATSRRSRPRSPRSSGCSRSCTR